MCLSIVAKHDLSAEQVAHIESRLLAPEHVSDAGPPRVWHIYQHGLYAVVLQPSNMPIGLVEASGDKDCVSPGWWLDKNFRGKGYGSKLVDALADHLKAQGFTGAGRIEIQTTNHAYDAASKELAKRFQKHFPRDRNG